MQLNNSLNTNIELGSSCNKEALSPEQKSTLLKIREKFFNISKEFLSIIKWISLAGGILAVVNYKQIHSDLEIINNQDGTHIYKHPDERTTHLLNVLAGKEKFTEEDYLIQERGRFYRFLKRKDIKLDKSLDKMSIEELDEAVTSYIWVPSAPKGDYLKSFYKSFEDINKIDTTEQKPNKDIYELVWQLEQECGNPKVRLLDDLGFLTLSSSRGQHFHLVENTIYVNIHDFRNMHINHLIYEMAHAKQFNDNQIGSYIQGISDIISIIKRTGLSNLGSFFIEYKKLYDEPGNGEYEVHKVIAPYLQEKYPLYIKQNNTEK